MTSQTLTHIHQLQAELRQNGIYLLALTEAQITAAIDAGNFAATQVNDPAQAEAARDVTRTLSDAWTGQ